MPQPRVSTPMHTGAIAQIRLTADGERLVTVGQDKTVRVWRLSDLASMRTLRLPGDAGVEGTLFALALAPDGTTAYVGGWTGIGWHRSSQIYAVDLESGRLQRTLPGIGRMIVSMAMSPDGSRLAVGLEDRLKLVDPSTGATLAEDREYHDQVSFVDFDPLGRLATSSADGCLRLYDAALKPIFRAEYPPRSAAASSCLGAELGGVRFSPDGKRLAFGLQDRPEVVVMDAATTQVLRIIRRDDPNQQSLCCISWSPDSQTLNVYGYHRHRSRTPLYRVDEGGLGAVVAVDAGRNTLTNSVGLADGGIVFSTDTPELIRLDRLGRVVAQAGAAGGDFREIADRFQISDDGTQVMLPLVPGTPAIRLSPLRPAAEAVERSPDMPAATSLAAPVRDGTVQVVGTLGRYSYKSGLAIGAVTIPMAVSESTWSWAGHRTLPFAALGTSYEVKLVNAQAALVWTHPFPAAAYGVNISADGRWVVAALGDGTIRWLDAATGDEKLGLFMRVDGQEWVAWRPDGYYASSPHGDELLGWLVNRGDRQTPDFWRAVQFEHELYRPDAVIAALQPGVDARDGALRLQAALKRLAPPRVTIESVRRGQEPGTLAVRFRAEPTGQPIREVGVYLDGLPALTTAERQVSPLRLGEAARGTVVRTVVVRAPSTTATVRVEAESALALGLDEAASALPPALGDPSPRGRLWVVSVGVQSFDRLPGLRPLPYATNDAVELGKAFVTQAGKAYAEVRTVVLSEASADKPTKLNILRRLRELEQMRQDDTVVVFLASHGTTDASEYYFMTKDADPGDVAKLIAAQARRAPLSPGAVPSLLTGSELTAAMRRLPGRRILMLDTCQAGAVGNSNPYALVKRSASAQLAVMSAAQGDESSYDSPDRPHGAFTIAIIDALAGRLKTPAGPITLRNAFDAATPQVQDVLRQIRARARDVAERASIRQTPGLTAPPVLQGVVLADR